MNMVSAWNHAELKFPFSLEKSLAAQLQTIHSYDIKSQTRAQCDWKFSISRFCLPSSLLFSASWIVMWRSLSLVQQWEDLKLTSEKSQVTCAGFSYGAPWGGFCIIFMKTYPFAFSLSLFLLTIHNPHRCHNLMLLSSFRALETVCLIEIQEPERWFNGTYVEDIVVIFMWTLPTTLKSRLKLPQVYSPNAFNQQSTVRKLIRQHTFHRLSASL